MHFSVHSKEMRWFTIMGPILSADQVEKYNRGEYTFYFVATVMIQEQGVIKSMDNCGFVTGNNPRAVMECPSSTSLDRRPEYAFVEPVAVPERSGHTARDIFD